MTSTFIKFKVKDKIKPVDGKASWIVMEVRNDHYALKKELNSGLGKSYDEKVSSVKFIDYAYELVERFKD